GIARDAAGNLYVANPPLNPVGGGSITVYAPEASGNAAPVRTLTGDSTGLYNPGGIVLDRAGNVYVTNTYTATAFAPGASGDAGLNGPSDIVLDAARNVYVTNTGGYSANAGSVTVFAAGASGNAIPTRTIAGCNTGIGYPWGPRGLELDTAGNVYVAVHIPTF